MARCPTCYRRLPVDHRCPDHGEAPVSAVAQERASPAEPPDLESISVTRILASAGFADVWECVSEDHPMPIVIKVGHTMSEVARARFAQEARIMAQLGAPHVPQLHGAGVLLDGRPYLLMEHLGYETLAATLQQFSRPPSLRWLRSAGSAILRSLEAAHAHGVVHRDIKPENIFLTDPAATPDHLAETLPEALADPLADPLPASTSSKPGWLPTMTARLIDFGITKDLASTDRSITRAGTILGTPEYMAPEQIGDPGDIDYRADIYSFGILLYEFLTLRVPFCGEAASIKHGHQILRPPRPSQFTAVPGLLEDLCLSCLAKSPDRRPDNAARARELLEQACDAARGVKRRAPTNPSAGRLLTSAQQPVILVGVFLNSLDQAVSNIVARHKGVIARQWGRRYLCAFSGLMDEDPVREAVAAAREICDRLGARVAMHLASLKLRRSRQRGALKVYGVEVEHPERWMPSGPWQGVVITSKVARLLPPESTRPQASMPGFATLITDPVERSSQTTLVGREDLLARARQSFEACIERRTPTLFTVFGGHGEGKSRLAHELAMMVRRHAPPEIKLATIAASRRGLNEADATCRLLLTELPIDSMEQSDPDLTPVSPELPGLALVRALGSGMRGAARVRPFVLILDDAHYADSVILDAIEYASLDSPHTPLWIAVISDRRLEQRRPQWGNRAYDYQREELRPLGETDTMSLAAELLQPVEFPPAITLRHLAQWTGGNPQLLTELIRTLKQADIVRQRANGGNWYLATGELDVLPASPVGQWMASRSLENLPPELAACARLCAVLGVEFLRAELEWVLNASELSSTASTPIDVDVGLSELERRGILVHSTRHIWWFRQANFQASVYQVLAEADCEQLHHHALAFWRSQGSRFDVERVLLSIARHAGACGEWNVAMDAHLTLGDRDRKAHRHVDADAHYTAALKYVAKDDILRRLRALIGRAKVRYRVQRTQEALEDLLAADIMADILDEDRVRADLFLERATVFDWMEKYVESAELVDRAEAIIEHVEDPALEARLLMARGRSAWRQEQFVEAAALLGDGAQRAAELDDRETQILSLVLQGPALAFSGNTEQARLCFDEAITLCERVGDGLHLCVAYANRLLLWRNQPQRAIADLRHAIRLARELGQPSLERVTTHNLAEILHWAGDDRQALDLARRAHALQHHVSPEPSPDDLLLLARIHASRGDMDDVRRLMTSVLDDISASRLAPSDQLILDMLELYSYDNSDEAVALSWDALIDCSRDILAGEEFLEVLYFRILAALQANRADDASAASSEAHTLLPNHTIFERRFTALDMKMPAVAGTR